VRCWTRVYTRIARVHILFAQGRRPLIPPDMPMTGEVREVLETCRTVARLGAGCLGAYVISMAKRASDVLAVELLQREANFQVCVSVSAYFVFVCVRVCIGAEAGGKFPGLCV